MTIQEASIIVDKMNLVKKHELNYEDAYHHAAATIKFSKAIQCFTSHKINDLDSMEDQIETAVAIADDFKEIDISRLNPFQIIYLHQHMIKYAESLQNIAYKLMAMDGQTVKFMMKL